MSKIEEVRSQMVQAMKSGEKARKDVLSLLLSALKAKWVDKHADLTEEEENAVIQREIKQTKEAMETAPKDRKDIIEKNRFALSVLEEFAPKGLSEEEIAGMIRGVLGQLGNNRSVSEGQGTRDEGADADGEGTGGRRSSQPHGFRDVRREIRRKKHPGSGLKGPFFLLWFENSHRAPGHSAMDSLLAFGGMVYSRYNMNNGPIGAIIPASPQNGRIMSDANRTLAPLFTY